MADALGRLQTQYRIEKRRQRTTNLIMVGIALLGVGLACWSAVTGAKKKAGPRISPGMKARSGSA